MKKLLAGVLIFGFLSGVAGADILSSMMASREAVSLTAVKRVDVGGTWGYILTLSNGQRQYVENPQLQKQIEMIDKQIDALKAKRAGVVDVMQRCGEAK